jgi:hypothetical protein
MTPILFLSSFVPSHPLPSGYGVFEADYAKPYFDGAGSLKPHLIEGHFEASNPGRMTFVWNPQRALPRSVKATVLSSFFPSLKMEAGVRLRFSVSPPTPAQKGIAYPFPRDFQPTTVGDDLVAEPTTSFFKGAGG